MIGDGTKAILYLCLMAFSLYAAYCNDRSLISWLTPIWIFLIGRWLWLDWSPMVRHWQKNEIIKQDSIEYRLASLEGRIQSLENRMDCGNSEEVRIDRPSWLD